MTDNNISILTNTKLLPNNGTPSRFEQMVKKYDVVTYKTGYDLYQDPLFRIDDDYLEFMSDYNRMIHREIQLGNHESIYTLCHWIYYCDRAFPWFDPMMEVALKSADIKTFTLVYWMRQTWYEERYDSLTHEQMCDLAKGCRDESLKIELLSTINCLNSPLCNDLAECSQEDEDGNEPWEKYFEMQQKAISAVFESKLYGGGILIENFYKNYEEAFLKSLI